MRNKSKTSVPTTICLVDTFFSSIVVVLVLIFLNNSQKSFNNTIPQADVSALCVRSGAGYALEVSQPDDVTKVTVSDINQLLETVSTKELIIRMNLYFHPGDINCYFRMTSDVKEADNKHSQSPMVILEPIVITEDKTNGQ